MSTWKGQPRKAKGGRFSPLSEFWNPWQGRAEYIDIRRRIRNCPGKPSGSIISGDRIEKEKKMKVLLVGESWSGADQHTKGFDVVTLGSFKFNWGKPYIDAVRSAGIELDHMHCHIAQSEFPVEMNELKKYDVIIFSDVGSNTLLLDPVMQWEGVPRPNRLKLLVEYIRQGGGFIMFGGWVSFAGFENKARYAMTPLAEALPVEILNYDDRIEEPSGVIPEMVMKNHPVLDGVEEKWPAYLGYNKVKAKADAQEIARIDGSSFMAGMEFGKGRSFAFATDCVGHWGYDMIKWSSYRQLMSNMIRWAAKEI